MLLQKNAVYSIPGKLNVQWLPQVRAIVDGWQTYAVTLAEFREAVLVRGLSHARQNKGCAWIVDSSAAKGVFSEEIQRFIGSDVFPAFAKNGITHFITISSSSSLTNMSISAYKAKLGPNGIKLVELGSVEQAAEWLAQNT